MGTPLVEAAADRAQIAAVVREIAVGLDAWHAANPAAVAVHGDRALLRAYLAKDGTVEDPDDIAGRSLATALDRLGEGGFGLFGGLAHDAWLVAHLTDEVALAGALEDALVRALPDDTDNFDLIGGLAGLGVLAVERRSAPLAARIVDRLERLARANADGLAWHSPPSTSPGQAATPDGYVDLGIAHGIPGVSAVRARFLAAGLEVERAARLVDGAVAYLLADRHAVRAAAAGRVAWCHGDLGIALAVHAAAVARDRDDWRVRALELARGMARRAFADANVADPGLCHGSAGAAHLLSRLHQATGEPELAIAARAWLDRTLAERRAGEAIAGFPALRWDCGWQPAAELLSGAAGVALALHAAISELEPSWDRLLVADLPTAEARS